MHFSCYVDILTASVQKLLKQTLKEKENQCLISLNAAG